MTYFTIEELTRSDTAARRGQDNTPTPAALRKLHELTEAVLDPLRQAWGRPIHVNSGYRSPAVNKAVGGAANSQHTLGEAADITAGSPALNKELYELAVRLRLPYDQLIDERGYRWLHISYRRGNNRRQTLHQ